VPGPAISLVIGFDCAPRVGEQIEFEDHPRVPDGIYYVHKVRHVYQDSSQHKTWLTVEVSDTVASA
jgi:hypothetical protein